jgi:phage baseplate assembly protein W
MPLYNGFSTINRQKKYRLGDFELAKQDLFNHLRIRRGEKLMNPNFGTIIWDMLYEQLTDDTKQAIIDDLNRVIQYDPRLVAESLNVYEYENGLQIAMELRYVDTDQVEFIKYNFDRDQQL